MHILSDKNQTPFAVKISKGNGQRACMTCIYSIVYDEVVESEPLNLFNSKRGFTKARMRIALPVVRETNRCIRGFRISATCNSYQLDFVGKEVQVLDFESLKSKG